jgi:hypothetical protein
MSHFDSLTQLSVRLTGVTSRVSPMSPKGIQQPWAGVPMPEAVKNRVSQDIIELNNRWRKFDRARGMKPSLGMKDHYTEIKLMLPALWQCSRAT